MAIIQGNAKQGSTRGFYPKVINGSLRFNDDDTAYLSWTPASAGNRKTWTLSMWVKRGNLGIEAPLWYGSPSGTYDEVRFETNDTLNIYSYSGSYQWRLATTQVFRDPSAWYHFVVALDTTVPEVKFYVNGEQVTAFSTNTQPSTNYEGGTNNTAGHGIGMRSDGTGNEFDGYLANVHFIDGQALTASDFGETKNGVWVAKDYAGTFGTNGFYLTFEDDTEVEAFNTVLYRGTGSELSVTGTGFTPDLVWCKRRDSTPSHSLQDSVRGPRGRLFSDTTAAEDQNSGVISFDSDGFTIDGTKNATGSNGSSYVAWCWDAGANNAVTGHSSVTYTGNGGTQTISGFPFSPDLIWIKARNTASFYHHISDSVRGFDKYLFPNVTLAEETNTARVTSTTNDGMILGNKNDTNTAYNYVAWAWDAGDGDPVSNTDGSITSTVKASQVNGFSIVSYTGDANASKTIGHGLSTSPDMIIVKGRNVAQNWVVYHSANTGSPETQRLYLDGTNATDTVAWWDNTAPTSSVFSVSNFGGTGGAYNYIAYCWHNVTGKQKFGTYTGNGSTSGPTVTTGFRPGWLLIKRTDSASVNGWYLYDGSRNTFSPWGKILLPNSSGAEGDNTDDLIISDTGFTLNDAYVDINASGGTYIYAAFAGSYSDYITDYNTDGSIDSRVKASDTTGFSIVSYIGNGSSTGATVGHGLSSAPSMIVFKNRDSALNWDVYHTSIGATNRLHLNTTNASATTDGFYNTAPTTSVFTVNYGSANVNAPSASYIAYCWSETTGYSKFGSYEGNSSTSGPSVTCGFRPSVVIIKGIDSTPSWYILDSTRDTDGKIGKELYPNLSNAEGDNTAGDISFSDTGFQIITASSGLNANAETFIYAAFADTREAAFWLDQSGNDNDWQPVNLDHNDTVADSPTNNFATLNPLNKGTNLVTSDGNLSVNNSATEATHRTCVATHGMTSGKYYWEIEVNNSANVDMVGIVGQNATINSGHVGTSGFGYGYNTTNGNWYKASGWADDGTTPAAFPTSGTIGVAFDADNKKIYFSRNGVWINNANPTAGTGANGTYTGSETVFFPAISIYSNTGKWVANFGQQPFKYDPPA